jgi:hypothetical protein
LCSARLSHQVTVLTAAGVLCLAASGTVAVTWAAPSASPAQAADMLSPHSVTRTWAAGTAQQPPQDSLARQAVLIGAVDRAAAVQAAAVARAAARAAAGRVAARQAAAEQAATAAAVRPLYSGTPRQVAGQLLVQYGWAGQFSCLDALWGLESGWNVYAENPSSGAYGIPQALPASKMASAGPDWRADAATQINWGLGYIRVLYGSPCTAWDHEEAVGWY